MSDFSHATLIEYGALYPNDQKGKEEIIRGAVKKLNTTIAFPIIARLSYTARYVKPKDYRQEIQEWFGSSYPDLIKKYSDLIANSYSEKKDTGSLKLINLWSNLKLLEYILEEGAHHLTDEAIGTEDVLENLLKAYVLINELFTTVADAAPGTIPTTIDRWEQYFYSITLRLLPYHDLVHLRAADLLFIQFIKAGYFLQFFQEFAPLLLDEFLAGYGLTDWKRYLKAIMPVADHALRSNEDGLGHLTIDPANPNAELSKKILSALAVGDKTNYDQEVDFKLIRGFPLMKLDEYRYLIIDEILVYNKMYNSLYFEFAKIVGKKPGLVRKGDFKGLLNDHFTENYLVKAVLGKIFNAYASDPVHFSGAEIKEKYKLKGDSEPDYYARDQSKIYLFEIKDSLISGEAKQSGSYAKVEKELREKFYFYTKEKLNGELKESPKAIKQLLNNIKRIFANDLPFDKEYQPDEISVFPIMLYLDQAISTPGVNDILQFWFDKELDKHPELVKFKRHIMPLTLIDLDSIILYHNQFKKGELNFNDLIFSYWHGKTQFKKTAIAKDDKLLLGKSLFSFADFLKEVQPKRQVADLFFDLAKILFDESSPRQPLESPL